jgi:two-component system, LytTR family, response regulator
MSPIRTLIIDDEPIARRGIRRLLRNEPDVEIVKECTNGREAVSVIKRESPDLVFLDVQMPLLDGFGVIAELSPDEIPEIVFITAYDEYSIRAFEVNALDYLLKPIDPERFRKTMARTRKRLGTQQPELEQKLTELLRSLENGRKHAQTGSLERLAIREAGRVHFVNVDEISWISAEGNYIKIHAGRTAHLLRETMDGIEAKLSSREFVRIRRSTIIRTSEIKELRPLINGEYSVLLRNGTELTSSRRNRKHLETLFKS